MREEHSLLRVSGFDESDTRSDGSDKHTDIESATLQERDSSERNSRYDSEDSNDGSFHSDMGWVLAAFDPTPDGTIQRNQRDCKTDAGS